MKVSELKELLLEFPDDMDIVLQMDPEGNGYHFFRCYGPAHYKRGKYGIEECYSEEDYAYYEVEGHNCLVLSP